MTDSTDKEESFRKRLHRHMRTKKYAPMGEIRSSEEEAWPEAREAAGVLRRYGMTGEEGGNLGAYVAPVAAGVPPRFAGYSAFIARHDDGLIADALKAMDPQTAEVVKETARTARVIEKHERDVEDGRVTPIRPRRGRAVPAAAFKAGPESPGAAEAATPAKRVAARKRA